MQNPLIKESPDLYNYKQFIIKSYFLKVNHLANDIMLINE